MTHKPLKRLNPNARSASYIKNSVATHFAYHNRYDCCDKNIIMQAYNDVKNPSFSSVCDEVERLAKLRAESII